MASNNNYTAGTGGATLVTSTKPNTNTVNKAAVANGVNAYNTAEANRAAANRNTASVSTPATNATYARTETQMSQAQPQIRYDWLNPNMSPSTIGADYPHGGYMTSTQPANVVETNPETTIDPATLKPVTDYLNQYNTDREQKIRDLYAGNLDAENAGYKTALDTNLGNLKTAYDANLGNLKTAYDNNTGSLKTAYDANTGTLKTAYDTNAANLLNAYYQNLSDAYAARDKISPQYQQTMNALASEYEREKRNNNMKAAVSGINTGAGSQAALAQSAVYQGNQANLARSENEALNEAERGITDLGRNYQNQQNILNTEYANNIAALDQKYANEVDKLNREYQNNLATYGTTYQNNIANMKTNYENQIAQAAANNNYQLAAALLDEYGSQYDRMQNQAALLAQFGDFSAYAELYGQQAADTMKLNWALNNPEVAWASGNLKAEDYYALTGRYPADPTMQNMVQSSSSWSGGSKNKYSTPGDSDQYRAPNVRTGYYGGVGGSSTNNLRNTGYRTLT